MSILALQHS